MATDLNALLIEIDNIHSDADIDQEITDKVNAAVTVAVEAQVPAVVAADTSTLQAQLDASNAALKAVVDKLTVMQSQTSETSAALATAQNALAAAPSPEDAANGASS